LKTLKIVRDLVAQRWDGRTNARSDRVVLEFFVSFLFKQKRKRIRTMIELYLKDCKHSRFKRLILKIKLRYLERQ